MRRFVIAACCALFAISAIAGDSEEQAWMEGDVTLPAFPDDKDLIEFYVSAATSNRFFIDGKTLSVGSDGVVRYVLVVLTSGGATNVTFEGMRCGVREYRIYATGHRDRNWGGMRSGEWRAIENKPVNRHHAALSRDYFCPLGNPIFKADEGRDALRRGGHPQVTSN